MGCVLTREEDCVPLDQLSHDGYPAFEAAVSQNAQEDWPPVTGDMPSGMPTASPDRRCW